MKTTGNTVLITGGATGIGFSLAEHLVQAGNRVIICGRRQQKLAEAKARLPQLYTRQCDLSRDEQRRSLHDWATFGFEGTNILINNAGIQRMIDFNGSEPDLTAADDEIETNLRACIHMSALFIPDFLARQESAIVNISSGLAFVPLAAMPVYCATKAALHSFSMSLRHQLRDTPIKVFEIIPPMVDTDLDQGGRERRGWKYRGLPPAQVALAAVQALEKNEYESAVGDAQGLRLAAAGDNESKIFQLMNAR